MPNKKSSIRIPGFLIPKAGHNHGNYALSLGNFCRWLGEQAESLGVMLFPGFAASEILYNEGGAVVGVATGDMGVAERVSKKVHSPQGMNYVANTQFLLRAAEVILVNS